MPVLTKKLKVTKNNIEAKASSNRIKTLTNLKHVSKIMNELVNHQYISKSGTRNVKVLNPIQLWQFLNS